MTPISLKADWQGATVGQRGSTLYAADLNNNFNAIQQAINNLIGATATSGDLHVNSVTTEAGVAVGGALAVTGSATLGADPIAALGAATKQYVDASVAVAQTSATSAAAVAASKLPLVGGTLTGPLTLAGPPSGSLDATSKSYVDSAVSGGAAGLGVLRSGDTMTGPLILSGDPTQVLGASTKQYTDAVAGVAAAALARSGGTMTGAMTLSGDPTTALQPATKQYADAQFSQCGLRLIQTQSVGAVTSVPFALSSQYGTFKLILRGVTRSGGATSSLGIQGSANGGTVYVASYFNSGTFNSTVNGSSALSLMGTANTIAMVFNDFNAANEVFAEVSITVVANTLRIGSQSSGAKNNGGAPYFCTQTISALGGGTMDHIRLLWDDGGSFSAVGQISLYGYAA